MMIFPEYIMRIFTNDVEAIAMGTNALRIMFLLAITVGVQMVTGGVFQALGKAKIALVLSMSRQVLFMIPLLVTLPFIFGVLGVWIAFPIADLLSLLLAVWYIKNHKSFFLSKHADDREQVNHSVAVQQ